MAQGPTTVPPRNFDGGVTPGQLQPVAAQVPAIRPQTPRATTPKVESFDEHHLRAQPNDTIKGICERFYMSSKYERALLLFNRSHPMCAEGCRHDPPVLQAGESVFLPPVWVLEKRYANVIPGLPAPTPIPAVGPSNPPVGTANGKVYKVSRTNQRFINVAQETLGDPMRWEDIYRLNPTFNPQYPLPMNTILRMPADAKVP